MIKDEKIDKELQGKGVKFLPFVGDQYWYGISFNDNGELVLGTKENPGKKVLVLNENHYCDKDLNEEKLSSFTRDVLGFYLNSEQYSGMRTFVKFERALSNTDTDSEERKGIWEHLIFYNYLQTPLYSARMVRPKEDYETAATPFYKVLEIYKPDCIIVWGERLCCDLPTINMCHCLNLSSDVEIMVYDFRKYKAFVMPMYHPVSCLFSCGFWHENIVEFFKKCLYGTEMSI